MNGFVSFEFDLPGALLEQLIEVLDGMSAEHLTMVTARAIPDAQGVYQLFLDGRLVYIGKTDAEAGLRKRLLRHAGKILNRPNLETHDVAFKAVQVLVFTAMDLETMLINRYKRLGQATAWNGSGFGSNDPGRERETTNRKPEGFDDQFPISVDVEHEFLAPGSHTVATALSTLKQSLNYTLRYETEVIGRRAHPSRPHPDLLAATLLVAKPRMTMRETLTEILAVLPDGWQSTIFASHVILYKENRPYTYGEVIRK